MAIEQGLMDYAGIFEISASGMDYQAKRLEVIASNLANINTTRGINSRLYQPLVALASADSGQFDQLPAASRRLTSSSDRQPPVGIQSSASRCRRTGLCCDADINPVDEILAMMTATRAYEANIQPQCSPNNGYARA